MRSRRMSLDDLTTSLAQARNGGLADAYREAARLIEEKGYTHSGRLRVVNELRAKAAGVEPRTVMPPGMEPGNVATTVPEVAEG